jgi:DNA-binding transcriptional MerR regulator
VAAGAGPKSPGAFRTIGEVSAQTGVPQHVLRYWETRFPQLKPVTRAGSRRYYRPEDVALVERIDRLLNHDGYTVKGAQAVIAGGDAPAGDLQAVRDLLARALAEDR